MGPGEEGLQVELAPDGDNPAPDRLTLIKMVDQLMEKGASTEEIVDTIINELTPEDGAECPVCGINP